MGTRAMTRIFACCLAILLLAAASAAHALELRGAATQCVLPAGFAIADGNDVAPEIKGFLGQFSGYWGDKLHHTLIVSEIAADGAATAYYAHDQFGPWEINAPWCGRVPATISSTTRLTVARRSGSKDAGGEASGTARGRDEAAGVGDLAQALFRRQAEDPRHVREHVACGLAARRELYRQAKPGLVQQPQQRLGRGVGLAALDASDH